MSDQQLRFGSRVRRLRVRNYKSIQTCDIPLSDLTLLVGRNGAGKSNVLDAMRFVADSLETSLGNALRDRGGINEVRRRSRGHPTHFGFGLTLQLPDSRMAHYAFEIAAKQGARFEVKREELAVDDLFEIPGQHFAYELGKRKRGSIDALPRVVESDRLALPLVASLPEFREAYDAMAGMGFYSISPDKIRDLQDPDPGILLERDGSNLAPVVRRLAVESPRDLRRAVEYLGVVVPNVRDVRAVEVGPKETLEFRQDVAGSPEPWRFNAASVSDGTLRALAVLVSVFQSVSSPARESLVAIEEPEAAIHPGAAMKLMDALIEASRHRQVLVTTHSPDLLDHPRLDSGSVLAVESRSGTTVVAPIEPGVTKVIQDNLYTIGELLRLDQLTADDDYLEEKSTSQLNLFSREFSE